MEILTSFHSNVASNKCLSSLIYSNYTTIK